MIRWILIIWLGVLLSTGAVLIMFWRDVEYAPQSTELWLYFGLLPVLFSLLLCSPYLLWKWRQKRLTAQVEANSADRAPAAQTDSDPTLENHWIRLQVFSAAVQSALGENQALLAEIQKNPSPELDPELLNPQGHPILSYRITDLQLDAFDDQLLDGSDSTDMVDLDSSTEMHSSEQRLRALLQQQLAQHVESLQLIAAHLQRSALFYQTPVAPSYRLHPAWVDPEHEAEPQPQPQAQHDTRSVPRLEQLNIVLILSERFLAHWDEDKTRQDLERFLQQLGIDAQYIQCQYHYFNKENCYSAWLAQLDLIEQQSAQVSLLLVLDSEIDQACIDEKSFAQHHYVASEFGSSCCIASSKVQIDALEPIRVLQISHQQQHIASSLEQLKLNQWPQFQQLLQNPAQHAQPLQQQEQWQEQQQQQQEQPFVMLLQNSRDRQQLKKLQLQFAQTPIEMQQVLFAADSLGHSDDLAKLFAFMLALHIDPALLSLIHSTEHPQHGVLSSAVLSASST